MKCTLVMLGIVASATAAPDAAAQNFPTDDPVIRQIWQEGMENSQTYRLAQVLLDAIGPRLTGSPGQKSANDWAVAMYESWGISARNEQYGTWRGWRRGITHIDLLEPRVRALEGTMLAWSPGTESAIEGGVVIFPHVADSSDLLRWLPEVRGKFVLVSPPQPTCRPDSHWEEYAAVETVERMQRERREAQQAWNDRLRRTGLNRVTLPRRLEESGALGILTSRWSAGWGVNKIFSAATERVPTLDLSCEDYGLVFRLAEHGQVPVLRVLAEAELLGDVPVYNTIGEIRGSQKPDEVVMLSAHFDSWDGASGATDNGTGTITMLEAMRILKKVYPNPKRTILVGHWSGEEQGLNGSRAFVHDHPEVVEGLQALFNQDNGTWRVNQISMMGLIGAAPYFARWFAKLPTEMSQYVELNIPGLPARGGSDHASFICAGAPGFRLRSDYADYRQYTWHTNRDTFDKIVFDDLKFNATLTAMLVYLASEEPDRLPRERRVLPVNPRTGRQMTWPECRDGRRRAQ